MDFNRRFKAFERVVSDNSPMLLTGLGVAGVITTAYLTGQSTLKAVRLIDREDPYEMQSFQNKVKLVWPEYIPPVSAGVMTISCIIASHHISNRRAAALAAAYSLSERAMVEYKEKVIARLGEKKEQAFRDEIAQDRVALTPASKQQIVLTGSGDVLCFDAYSGRYFTSNVEAIRKSQNALNHQILNEMYASLSDFYHLIGLPSTSFSDEVGWTSDKLLELEISTVLSEDERPCLSIGFNVAPIRNYYKIG